MFRLFLPSSFRDPGLKNQISLLPSATLLHKLCMRRAIANSKATCSSIFYLNVGSSWDSHSAGRFILQTQQSHRRLLSRRFCPQGVWQLTDHKGLTKKTQLSWRDQETTLALRSNEWESSAPNVQKHFRDRKAYPSPELLLCSCLIPQAHAAHSEHSNSNSCKRTMLLHDSFYLMPCLTHPPKPLMLLA